MRFPSHRFRRTIVASAVLLLALLGTVSGPETSTESWFPIASRLHSRLLMPTEPGSDALDIEMSRCLADHGYRAISEGLDGSGGADSSADRDLSPMEYAQRYGFGIRQQPPVREERTRERLVPITSTASTSPSHQEVLTLYETCNHEIQHRVHAEEAVLVEDLRYDELMARVESTSDGQRALEDWLLCVDHPDVPVRLVEPEDVGRGLVRHFERQYELSTNLKTSSAIQASEQRAAVRVQTCSDERTKLLEEIRVDLEESFIARNFEVIRTATQKIHEIWGRPYFDMPVGSEHD